MDFNPVDKTSFRDMGVAGLQKFRGRPPPSETLKTTLVAKDWYRKLKGSNREILGTIYCFKITTAKFSHLTC